MPRHLSTVLYSLNRLKQQPSTLGQRFLPVLCRTLSLELMANRSVTRDRTHFSLPEPASASFDFLSDSSIKIRVPAGSSWCQRTHWHCPGSLSHCNEIEAVNGRLMISYAPNAITSGTNVGSEGARFVFELGKWERHSWRPDPHAKDKPRNLDVILNTNVDLYRNICSAILDASRYPYLSTTPLWIKAVLKLLSLWPRARVWLLTRLLYLQIQVMNEFFGYRELHGQAPFIGLWSWTHPFNYFERPPVYILKLQWDSAAIISSAVQKVSFWVGTCALGMQGRYDEYTSTR